MNIFISQPMKDFTEEEIFEERKRIERIFFGNCIVNPYHPENARKKSNLQNLGESIAMMANADLVVAPRDFWDYSGCYIETEVARRYDIPMCCIDMYPHRRRDMVPVMEGVVKPNA